MNNKYDRPGSKMIAVRFPLDVHKLVTKRKKRADPFCAKLYAAIRKLAALEKRCDDLGVEHADL